MASPRFPLYIVSKGRASTPYTMRQLSMFKQPHHVVVEEQEADEYIEASRKLGGYGTVLLLDPEFQAGYDACMELPDGASRGSGPARNFAWEHAVNQGAGWHWTMDDNIMGFVWLNRNQKRWAGDASGFRMIEDFVTQYENIAMAGPHYDFFAPAREKKPPFKLNSRIYSCNLIRCDLKQRWRGRYNEDTILSLDLLKAGWCTVLVNTFLQKKMTTQVLAGGNMEEIYSDGTIRKSLLLVKEHPDVVRPIMRFGREHHYADYSRFANRRLIRKPDGQKPAGVSLAAAPRPKLPKLSHSARPDQKRGASLSG